MTHPRGSRAFPPEKDAESLHSLMHLSCYFTAAPGHRFIDVQCLGFFFLKAPSPGARAEGLIVGARALHADLSVFCIVPHSVRLQGFQENLSEAVLCLHAAPIRLTTAGKHAAGRISSFHFLKQKQKVFPNSPEMSSSEKAGGL